MTDTYGPFDGAPWAEAEWFDHMPAVMPSGVIGSQAASASTGGLALTFAGLTPTIAAGTANVGGAGFKRDAAAAMTAVTANSHATWSRRDRIVLRRSRSTHDVTLVRIQGTAAASPSAPTITRDSTTFDLELFSFLVPPASGTTITGIVDERVWIDDGTLTEPQRAGDEFTGSTNGSGVATVTHGLGVTPRFVLITLADQASTQSVAKYVVTAKTSTTFQITAYRTDTGGLLASNPVHFYWEAVK